ncbi:MULTISPECIES: hypothetical protein [Streptomyces]|uniref:hypothetical protein n=1 Tax=Streptomyces TaxID=1883 RepID=UPI00069AECBA|nr:hypothetical protein [Streptomyces sp. SID7805]MYU55361.1 hypothetical protein [Streptomyces sp. SID7805]
MQWTALVSATVGAVIATLSSAYLDRHRWRRDQRDRISDTRRALYGEYLASLSKARNVFRSLARDADLGPTERERAARDGFAPCYEIRYQMSITASVAVVAASEDAFRRLRDVRDHAAAGALAGDEAYSGGRAEYETALTKLRAAMRHELGAEQLE